MSFTRRYQSFPSSQVIGQIEGIVIVDLPAPATIQGVSTGVVGVVGEFADMRYATAVDGSGNVTSSIQPQEVSSTADMINKFGGWDPTLGDFGTDDGNGYFTVDGKRFSRLVLCPVNLASSKAVRVWRELPTNAGSANPTPTVPMQGVTIPAGTPFQTTNANDVVNLATSVTFTATDAYLTGTNGVIPAGGSSPTHSFTATGAGFVTAGVQVGDILVVGVIDTDDDAGTYRIESVASETALVLEKLDGSSFVTTGGTDLPWRIHVSDTADSGGAHALASSAGLTLPARPIKVDGSSETDGTIDADTKMTEAVPAAAGTAISWSAKSGLTLYVGEALNFTAAIQKPNATTNSQIEALYQAAFDAMLSDSDPIRDVSVIVASRTSANIRNKLKTHVLTASSQGRGRIACISPELSVSDTSIALGSDYVGATRDERVVFCWPAVRQSFSAPVSKSTPDRIKLANGQYTLDGILDIRSDIFMASILSNLASERNPGQATDPVPLCMSPVLGFQSNVSGAQFNMTDYMRFRAGGVCAIRFDRAAGKVFQSGITSALPMNQKNINRRRMADEIQDSLADAYSSYVKQPLTSAVKSAIDTVTVNYLEGLKSTGNPAAQRIEDYSVDSVSGNTPELNAQGIYVVIVKVKMLATADSIVLQAEVGPTVNITTA